MEDYGGPAQPSTTIAQCLNGGYAQALHEAKSGRSCEIADHATALGRAVRRAVDRDLNEVRTATTRSRTTAYIVPLDYAVDWSVRRVDKSRDFRDGTFRTRRDVRCTAAIGGEVDIVAVSSNLVSRLLS